MKRGRMDERGVSLVELIIVMAIMAVIVGMTGFGLGMISNKPVDECAKKIEMLLNRNRTTVMGKKDAWLEFYLNDGRVTVQEIIIEANGTTKRIGDSVTIGADNVGMRLTYAGNTLELDTTHRKIGFRRDSGSLESKEGDFIYTKIEIYKGSYSKIITINELTGKVTVE